MTFRLPSRLTLLTSALLVLLPALAVLQYRWVGQLSDAERERMQRNMRHAAIQFREALDGEIARAFVGLQVDGGSAREEQWAGYAERYASWAATAAHPAIIANVFLIDSGGSQVRLRRWDPTARRFEVTAWNGALAPARRHFEQEFEKHRTAADDRRFDRSLFQHESLMIAPLVSVHMGPAHAHTPVPLVNVFGFTVLELNIPFIRTQLLPDLTARYFNGMDGQSYRVAVIDAANTSQVIYRSSPDAPIEEARADAAESIFGMHGDPLMFLARGALRQTSGQALRQGSGQALGEAPGRSRAAGHLSETRNVVVSVIRDRNDAPGSMRARIFDSANGRWRLLVQHQRGSLEAAVAGVRQRNLIISFGILLLMGVSVGLLTASSRRAQRLARQQMEFVAGVSHELRTPVAVIRSAAENLSHGVVGDLDRVRRYGDAIQVEARRLGEMVERVLHFAGIESGRQVAQGPVAIEAIVGAALDATLPAGEAVTVERHIAPELPPVAGDAAALRSAIQNLLTNALKYGGSDRWVGVRVEPHEGRRTREVRIIIEDHGRGIPAADLPHIFEPFYRGADAVARQIQGSGLGLALVRRIVEAHGGRVTVTSREGTGSAFTIYLPVAAAHTAANYGDLKSVIESTH